MDEDDLCPQGPASGTPQPPRGTITDSDDTATDLRYLSRIEADEARDREKRLTFMQSTWDGLIRNCGERYRPSRFSSYRVQCAEQRSVMESLQSMSARGPCSVLLFGPSGTGKDHLLIAAAFEAIGEGLQSICWASGPDLFGAARDLMDSHEPEKAFVRRYVRPRVLILSDPVPINGALSDYQASVVYRIVDGRYRECRPTWVTMNVARREDADTCLGVPIVDRLTDGAIVHYCNWPSYRKPLNGGGAS